MNNFSRENESTVTTRNVSFTFSPIYILVFTKTVYFVLSEAVEPAPWQSRKVHKYLNNFSHEASALHKLFSLIRSILRFFKN